MQLRKCCNHPYLFDGAEPGKLREMLDLKNVDFETMKLIWNFIVTDIKLIMDT